MTLDAAEMLARAEAATGLSDYGDPTLPATVRASRSSISTAPAWTRTAGGRQRTCATGC